jgi:hypothetical protein
LEDDSRVLPEMGEIDIRRNKKRISEWALLQAYLWESGEELEKFRPGTQTIQSQKDPYSTAVYYYRLSDRAPLFTLKR